MINQKSVLIIEFPSVERAKKWYASPEYAPLIAQRQRAANSTDSHGGARISGSRLTLGVAMSIGATNARLTESPFSALPPPALQRTVRAFHVSPCPPPWRSIISSSEAVDQNPGRKTQTRARRGGEPLRGCIA
jgi:Domain of unknown function (DUF1330)